MTAQTKQAMPPMLAEQLADPDPDPDPSTLEVSPEETAKSLEARTKFLAKESRTVQRLAQKFVAKHGLDEEVALAMAKDAAAERLSHGNGSKGRAERKIEDGSTVLDAARIAVFADRSDDQLIAHAIATFRRDGGGMPVVDRVQQLIESAGGDARKAAELVCERHAHHLAQVRWTITAAANEVRRRRAVEEGVDPKTITYLTVCEPKTAADAVSDEEVAE